MALAALALTVSAAGCGNARQAAEASAASSPSSSNERTLTQTQSVHLVRWATTYRGCMSSRGWRLGELKKAPTHLSMALPSGVEVSEMLRDSFSCGDAQGGPPAKSSLQFRARKILLYLPKQCLLDPKIVSS